MVFLAGIRINGGRNLPFSFETFESSSCNSLRKGKTKDKQLDLSLISHEFLLVMAGQRTKKDFDCKWFCSGPIAVMIISPANTIIIFKKIGFDTIPIIFIQSTSLPNDTRSSNPC